jgi:hypothetical protein
VPDVRRGVSVLLAGVLVVVGCLLVPVAATAWWARGTLSDSERFVSTVLPVAEDPAVQQRVEDQLVEQVMAWVDDQQVAQRSVQELIDRGVPPRVAAALALLTEPLRDRLEQTVRRVVEGVVESDQFVTAFETSLATVHQEFAAIVRGDLTGDELLEAAPDGTLSIKMATLSNSVRSLLIEAGVPGVERLPEVTAVVPIAQVDQLVTIRRAYRALDAAATWLPVLAVLALVGGVLLGRRRLRWAVGVGVGVIAALLLTLIGLALARSAVVDAVPADPQATRATVDLVSEPLRSLLRGVAAATLMVLIVGGVVVTLRDRPDVVESLRRAGQRASRSPLFPVAAAAVAVLCVVVLLLAELRPLLMLLVLAIGVAAGYAAWAGRRASTG